MGKRLVGNLGRSLLVHDQSAGQRTETFRGAGCWGETGGLSFLYHRWRYSNPYSTRLMLGEWDATRCQ